MLRGLAFGEVSELLRRTAGREVTAAVATAINERAEGNPFFASELARLLAGDEGLDDAAAVRRRVPVGVRDVVRQRLGRLPTPTVDLLAMAAVFGRDVDLDLLARAVDQPIDGVIDHLEPAVDARLLVEAHATGGGLRFSHALVRESLVDGLSSLRRARLHLRAADAVTAATGADEDQAEIVAEHPWAAVPLGVGSRAAAALERGVTWTCAVAPSAPPCGRSTGPSRSGEQQTRRGPSSGASSACSTRNAWWVTTQACRRATTGPPGSRGRQGGTTCSSSCCGPSGASTPSRVASPAGGSWPTSSTPWVRHPPILCCAWPPWRRPASGAGTRGASTEMCAHLAAADALLDGLPVPALHSLLGYQRLLVRTFLAHGVGLAGDPEAAKARFAALSGSSADLYQRTTVDAFHGTTLMALGRSTRWCRSPPPASPPTPTSCTRSGRRT